MNMEFTDPYFSVQEDILKNINIVKNAYEKISRLGDINSSEANTASEQLRQSMKSIEWDLEDLQDTMQLIENKPSRFHLSDADVASRRRFLSDVGNLIKTLKSNLNNPNSRPGSWEPMNFSITGATPSNKVSNPPNGNLKSNSSDDFQKAWAPMSPLQSSTKLPPPPPTTTSNSSSQSNPRTRSKRITYSHRSANQPNNTLDEQKQLLEEQDERLNQLGVSISTLKTMSHKIGNELSDQIVLLDDFSGEMSHTESRLDAVTKRTARLLHLNTNRQQWTAIVVLLFILFIIILLLIIL